MGRPRKSTKHAGGRPTVMTPDVIAKLEQVFAIDGTVEEACSYSDISPNSFYDYLKINPEFSKRISQLREKPVLKARQTVVTKLGEHYTYAMDYLKRKKKVEFGDNLDITSDRKPFQLTRVFTTNGIQNSNGDTENSATEKKD